MCFEVWVAYPYASYSRIIAVVFIWIPSSAHHVIGWLSHNTVDHQRGCRSVSQKAGLVDLTILVLADDDCDEDKRKEDHSQDNAQDGCHHGLVIFKAP